MWQDVRFGCKLLWKEKAFTLTALLTLALCTGVNTAIFSVLHTVILEPLPFQDSGRLVSIYNIYPGVGLSDRGSNGVPDYLDRRQLTEVFDSVSLMQGTGFDLGSDGSPLRVEGQAVTPSFFRVLRVRPVIGRLFAEEDAAYQKDKFAILSYGLWTERFGGSPEVLGRDVRLSGVPYRVVGVMPKGFASPGSEARVWVPLSFAPEQTLDSARHSNSWDMIARLRPGVAAAAAQRRIDNLNRYQLQRAEPALRKVLEDARFASVVHGLKDDMVKDVRPILYLLQAAVILVLLIGCVNVASLLLVRSNIRMKEWAIRHSLGAGRGRLARQLLTESVVLSGLGGALGVVTGFAGVRLLAYLGTRELPGGPGIHVDGTALVFTAALTLITGLVFGSVPVYRLFRRDLNAIFRQNGRGGTAEHHAVWIRSALVVSQVTLAFVLMIGAGLLAVSFHRLLAVDPGFQAEHVQTARFSLPRVRYDNEIKQRNFVDALLTSVRALPGVTHAGVGDFLPFVNDENASTMTVVGRELAPGEPPPVPRWITVDPGYFPTMGIRLLQVRLFQESDTEASPRVAIVDQYFAHKYFPKGDAVGGHILRGVKSAREDIGPPLEIVGVVANVKADDLAERNSTGTLYFNCKQFPQRSMYLAVRTAGQDAAVTGMVRAAMLKADSELTLFDAKAMPERIAGSMRYRRTAMVLCVVFAFLALALSAIGIYGVLAYTVTQRTREFGIRIALGAGSADVVRMVVGQGIRLSAIGLVLGVAGALALTRLIDTMLYGVSSSDPAVFTSTAAVLLCVALAASLFPSLRVVRIHPATALRYE